MTWKVRAAILAPAGIAVILGLTATARPHAERARRPGVQAKGCDHTLAEPAAAPPFLAVPLPELQREVRKRAKGVADLNELQDYLSGGLATGAITPDRIVELFRNETDAAVLDVLQGVLALHPELADGPGILEAFLHFATADSSRERRLAAIAFLGNAWDKDGRVRQILLGMGGGDPDPSIRMTSLATLQAYAQKNGEQAAAVNGGLLALARRDQDGEIRAQALQALTPEAAGEDAVRHLGAFVADPAACVRLAAADKLAQVPATQRFLALSLVEQALSRETETANKQLLLVGLVRLGGSVDVLRRASADPDLRADAEEYLAILQVGGLEWETVAAEKAKREAARTK